MKKLFTLLTLIATMATFAQAPEGFNYQATVRNSSGQLLLNQDVLVKFNILQNSSKGDIVYSETQTANTDDLGQINLVVGQGTAPTGTFSTINWGSGSYYLGIELNSGNGYVAMGTTQLLSVPYALYAKSAGSSISSMIHTRAAVMSANQLLFSIAEQESSTEPFVQLPITRQGKLKNLFIYPAGFTPKSGCSVTATIRVNGSDSPLNVIHSSNNGNSVTSNTSTEVSVNPGDLISVKILETNGVAPNGVYRITFELH